MQPNISEQGTRYQESVRTYWNLTQKRFYASEQGHKARKMLQELVDSADYDTSALRFGDSATFCERHLDTISRQPHLDLDGYMSNLRTMTRKRR